MNLLNYYAFVDAFDNMLRKKERSRSNFILLIASLLIGVIRPLVIIKMTKFLCGLLSIHIYQNRRKNDEK